MAGPNIEPGHQRGTRWLGSPQLQEWLCSTVPIVASSDARDRTGGRSVHAWPGGVGGLVGDAGLVKQRILGPLPLAPLLAASERVAFVGERGRPHHMLWWWTPMPQLIASIALQRVAPPQIQQKQPGGPTKALCTPTWMPT